MRDASVLRDRVDRAADKPEALPKEGIGMVEVWEKRANAGKGSRGRVDRDGNNGGSAKPARDAKPNVILMIHYLKEWLEWHGRCREVGRIDRQEIEA